MKWYSQENGEFDYDNSTERHPVMAKRNMIKMFFYVMNSQLDMILYPVKLFFIGISKNKLLIISKLKLNSWSSLKWHHSFTLFLSMVNICIKMGAMF